MEGKFEETKGQTSERFSELLSKEGFLKYKYEKHRGPFALPTMVNSDYFKSHYKDMTPETKEMIDGQESTEKQIRMAFILHDLDDIIAKEIYRELDATSGNGFTKEEAENRRGEIIKARKEIVEIFKQYLEKQYGV